MDFEHGQSFCGSKQRRTSVRLINNGESRATQVCHRPGLYSALMLYRNAIQPPPTGLANPTHSNCVLFNCCCEHPASCTEIPGSHEPLMLTGKPALCPLSHLRELLAASSSRSRRISIEFTQSMHYRTRSFMAHRSRSTPAPSPSTHRGDLRQSIVN